MTALARIPRTMKVKKGDTVLIHVGKDRGKTGKVLAAFPAERRILVEGLNIVKKHIRPRRAGEKGQRVEVPSPLPVSRAMLICPSCGKGTRVGIRRTIVDGQSLRERLCKKCSAVIP